MRANMYYKLALLVAVAALHFTVDIALAQTLDLGGTATTAATNPPVFAPWSGVATAAPGTVAAVATAAPGTVAAVATAATVATATVNPNAAVQTAVPGQTGTAVPGADGTAAPTEEGWGGCIDPTLSPDDNLVRLGKKTTICLVLSSSAEWNIPPPSATTLRLSFQPKADEYSRFHVPESYTDLIQTKSLPKIHDGSNNVTLHVASQKVLSFQRMFFSGGRVFPYLTAIIDVQKGVVKGITWDDACLFCSKSRCEENTYDFNGNMGTKDLFKQPTKGCFLETAECVATLGEENPRCDITLYVVWTGDDADGRALQSSAFRFSAFPAQELQNRVGGYIPDLPFGMDEAIFGEGEAVPDNIPEQSAPVAEQGAT